MLSVLNKWDSRALSCNVRVVGPEWFLWLCNLWVGLGRVCQPQKPLHAGVLVLNLILSGFIKMGLLLHSL